MNRTILIIIGVVVIIVVVTAGWWFFLRSPSTSVMPVGTTGTLPAVGTTATGTNGVTSGSPATGTVEVFPTGSTAAGGTGTTGTGAASQFGVVSNDAVLDYFVSASGTVTIVEPNGEIAQEVNAQPTYLSTSQIQNVISASFSYDGKKVLVNFGDPANPQTSIFDTTGDTWLSLPPGAISPTWSPSDYRIAYVTVNAGTTETLTTLDVSKMTNKPVALLTLNAQDLTPVWPSGTQIVLKDKPSVYAEGSAWLYDLKAKTLIPVVSEELGLETIWSDTTSTMGLAFSSGSGAQGGSVSFINPASGVTQGLTFFTLPTKCAFNYESSDSAGTPTASSTDTLGLYCAVPQNSTALSLARLPDDYNQLALFTVDSFSRVDTETGVVQTIFSPTVSLDATNLKRFGSALFFINRYDQKLYAISL